MDCIATRLPYRQTNHFTKIVLDYIDQSEQLKPFFGQAASVQGIQSSIEARKQFPTNRKLLVEELRKQYTDIKGSEKARENIESILSENTFTITTAHQNNIFLGPLYVIYKVIHAIKLADHLNATIPQNKFVPVFYMGTEDADLEELNHIYVDDEKIAWNTKQTGAVGRMKVDKELLKIISKIEGQISVLPIGVEIISLIKDCYREGMMMQDATFKFLNALFGEYGLVVLIADKPALKKQMMKIFEDDLMNQTASDIVQETSKKLEGAGYKTQAHPRDVNLFYLKDNIRNRIVFEKERYTVADTRIDFSRGEILKELNEYPERFSPNVILRGIYQETILPNIAFIGGGGELAYWLEFREHFQHYKVPYPVLILRNSFLIVEKKWQEKVSKLGFETEDFFLTEEELIKRFVAKESKREIKLNGNLDEAIQLYELIKIQAAKVDITLAAHVEALKVQTLHRLEELEKKMLRAEKRKFSDQQRQIHSIKQKLFPQNGLQERVDNFMYYYAKWGKDLIRQLYQHSLALEQEFVSLAEK
jgi:bacillithiol biosynthesis cysteine-adding enzyme BshC